MFNDVFNERRFSSEWYNRAAPSALAEAINAQCELMREDFGKYADCLRIMQIQASPTTKDLWETAGMWSLVRYAKKHNAEMIENPSFDGWMQVMPIVLCDFVTTESGDFNKNINEKIMAYNRNLVRGVLATAG